MHSTYCNHKGAHSRGMLRRVAEDNSAPNLQITPGTPCPRKQVEPMQKAWRFSNQTLAMVQIGLGKCTDLKNLYQSP